MRIVVQICSLRIYHFICFGLFAHCLQAQVKQSYIYQDVPESFFYETQWKYNYTLHVESQTFLHKAGENFSAYYYFRLDHEAEAFVNGSLSKSQWTTKGTRLIAPILNLDTLFIVKMNEKELVLEAANRKGKGKLQYYFTKNEDKISEFQHPEHLLPEVEVMQDAKKSTKNDKNWIQRFWSWITGDDDKIDAISSLAYINIEMSGGGFFGGIDPPIRNFIRIKTDGRLIREYATQYRGLTKTTKNIPRIELESFMDYIQAKGFFELKSSYECVDKICQKRMSAKPMPIPLSISVTSGNRHKVVTIAVFGTDESNVRYVKYPAIIDEMIEVMNRMSNRIDK